MRPCHGRDRYLKFADVAQQVEHVLGKDEVTGSSPVISSTGSSRPAGAAHIARVAQLARAPG